MGIIIPLPVEEKTGFAVGTNYFFDPPVETSCMSVNARKGESWKQKVFSSGWCIKFEKGVGVFTGVPAGSRTNHFFELIYGSGSSTAVEK